MIVAVVEAVAAAVVVLALFASYETWHGDFETKPKIFPLKLESYLIT